MKVELTLYITGQTIRSERAIGSLRHLCDTLLEDRCKLTIVDVLEDPDLAEQARILATPTLVKALPLPVQRIIGDLSDTERVLSSLGLPIQNEEYRGGDAF